MNRKILNQILLIDDDEPVNFLHEMVIKSSELTEASIEIKMLAQQGLEYLEQLNIDQNNPLLIFLDINMPGMDGWEFLEELDKMPDDILQNIVIVMLTTSLNPDDKSKGEQNPHVNKFLTKPLTKDNLQIVLEEFFPE